MEIGYGDFPVLLHIKEDMMFVLCLAGSISPISLRRSPEVGGILRLVDVEAMILDMAPLSPSHGSSNVSAAFELRQIWASHRDDNMSFITFKLRIRLINTNVAQSLGP